MSLTRLPTMLYFPTKYTNPQKVSCCSPLHTSDDQRYRVAEGSRDGSMKDESIK